MDNRLAIEPRGCVMLSLAEIDAVLAGLHCMTGPTVVELQKKFRTLRAAVIKQGGATVPAFA